MPNRKTSDWNVFCADIYCPMLSVSEVSCPTKVVGLKRRILDLRVHHAKLLDYFTDLYRDYSGRFFDPEAGFINLRTGRFQEVFVNTDCLIEAPDEWWRDQFAPINAGKPILKLRSETRPRWQALGSIYFAYRPCQRAIWELEAANDNKPPTQ